MPKPPTDPQDIKKLQSINTFFTGEFDSVLFAKNGPARVIDEDMGIILPPKPLTELDRLSYVFS